MALSKVFTTIGLVVVLASAAAPLCAQQQAPKPKVMTHEAQGRDNCLMCHSGAMQAIVKVPDTHKGRPNEVCGWCHAPNAEVQTKPIPPVEHSLEGRDKCMMCHRQNIMEAVPDVPASHEGRTDAHCRMCHISKPAGG